MARKCMAASLPAWAMSSSLCAKAESAPSYRVPAILPRLVRWCTYAARAIPVVLFAGALLLVGVISSPLLAEEPVAVSTEKKQVDSGARTVLFLNSYHPGYEWSDEVYQGLHSVLDPRKISIRTEYLDSKRYSDKDYSEFLDKLIRYKYGNLKLDVIVASDHYAVKSALAMRATFQRGVPLVYLGIDEFAWERRPDYEPIYGLEEGDGGVLGTIDLIFSVQPNVKTVYAVADGDTESAPVMLRYVHEAERANKRGATFKYLVGMSMADVEAAVRVAPRDSAVLWLHYIQDRNGRTLTVAESQKWLAGHSSAPVYCAYGFQPGSGVLGGHIISGLAQGKKAAEIAVQILEGKSPPSFYGTKAPCLTVFDYPVMRRFRIRQADIPADSVVYNKPKSVFEEYRALAIAVLTVIVVLSVMVAYLLLNIARRRKIEKSLAQSEERFRATFEQAAVGIAHVSPEGRFLRINKRYCDILGYSREEMLQRSFQDITYPADLASDLKRVSQMLAGEIDSYSMEKRYVRKDGALVWVNLVVALVRGTSGQPNWFVAAIQDVNEQKNAETETQQLRQEIMVANRAATMGELSAALAHQLNQPLTAILSNSEAALQSFKSGTTDAAELKEILADISADTVRAGEVIQHLRSLMSKRQETRKRLDLNEVVSRVLDLLHSDLVFRGATVDLRLAPDLLPVMGDRVELEQVLLNLAMNGLDAMSDVPPLERVLVIQTERTAPDGIKVAIRDRGCGISPDVMRNLFHHFFTTKPRGMGMGLPIARRIVERHGGRLWAENNPERGASFFFTLPADPTKESPAAANP